MFHNVTTVLAALLIAVAPSVHAQSSRPQFELSSVKPNNSGSQAVSFLPSAGRFNAQNVFHRAVCDRPRGETRRELTRPS
jgi:hypothetical protein